MTNAISMTDEEVRRLSWRCRRGLLELDIVLQHFSEVHLANLTTLELLAFDSLLDLSDNEFLDVVTSRLKFVEIEILNAKQLDADSMQTVITKLGGY